jgi:hypothetical protein
MLSSVTTQALWAVVVVLLSIWLGLLARSDLRTRTTPAWATALPLLVIGVVRTFLTPPDGSLWPGGVAVGTAVLMILLSDTMAGVPFAGMALLCAGAGGPETRVLVGSWVAALLLAVLGIWGAGDGKVFAALVGLFPDVRLVVAMGVALELGSGIALVKKYGRATPVVLLNVLHDALRLRFPIRTGEQGDHPAVPWLALGALVYLGLKTGGVL